MKDMAIKIEQEIVGYEVVKDHTRDGGAPVKLATPKESAPQSGRTGQRGRRESAEIIQMTEQVERPDRLEGTTYKIKTPLSDHAFYVTINDIILNEGTEHELRRPFEIFINSKAMEHFQWIVALTRIVSAVFRKGGDVTFLVDELKAVFDPSGGYFKSGGVYMPSLVAELGWVLERHLKRIGLLEVDGPDEHQQRFVAQKRAEYLARQTQRGEAAGEGFPEGAHLCRKCSVKAVVQLDNCLTCLNCGESKCG